MEKEYKPKFFVKPRVEHKKPGKDPLMGFWVIMPDGKEWNIWDFRKSEITKNIEDAIASAFERGFKAHSILISNVQDDVNAF